MGYKREISISPASQDCVWDTRKAIDELNSGKGTVCHSFEDYLKAVQ